MATKKKSKTEVETKATSKAIANATLRPSVNAAAVIAEYGKPFGEQDLGELMDELVDSINIINNGDMKRCEGMLLGQAYALQSIFMNLSRRATSQEHMKNYETFLRLALKAQGQCRATLETLAAIKNPPVIYAKQANISNGHQQINNGVPASHAGEIKNQPNELLEAQHGSTALDSRTTSATIGKDQAMATVE